jgi:hypothetical protein
MAGPQNSNQGGFPKHGDPAPEGDPANLPPEVDEVEEGEEEESEEVEEPDPVAALRSEVEALKADNEQLRKQMPPAQPKPVATPPAGKTKTAWSSLLFSNPDDAVEKIKAEAKAEALEEIRGEYTKDQNAKKFWADFYRKNKDLEDDHDLVELTLNSNLNKLANVPVERAMKELADLTRERIIRYAGGVKGKTRKTLVEGDRGPPSRPAPKPEAQVHSLSEVIRNRRKSRASAA